MPWYRFQIESHLTAQAVLERVKPLLRERPSYQQLMQEWRNGRPDNAPPFIGSIEDNVFKCYRAVHYRNSFIPRITGRVITHPTGTTIDVTMRLHPLAAIFMSLWMTGVGAASLIALRGDPEPLSLIPVVMLVAGLAMTFGGFYPEAIKARRLLEEQISGRAIKLAKEYT